MIYHFITYIILLSAKDPYCTINMLEISIVLIIYKMCKTLNDMFFTDSGHRILCPIQIWRIFFYKKLPKPFIKVKH